MSELEQAKERLRSMHAESKSIAGHCRACLEKWPCPVSTILEALERAEREVKVLRRLEDGANTDVLRMGESPAAFALAMFAQSVLDRIAEAREEVNDAD